MYIFLDVDGVLNTEADWARKVYSLNPKCVEQFLYLTSAKTGLTEADVKRILRH
jgi:histidinol phosphatase-like enzyme